ncbi:hypothetical protein MFM001_14120 [Mycobacterium sp. MFM001]|nr:hypothetical protein MFM001_14120 [Mycobacterium sp. MFM001]
MLCQLSYRGLPVRRGMTLAYGPTASPSHRRQPTPVWTREAGWSHAPFLEGAVLIRYFVVLGLGYVLGAKAGRRRYEQIVGTYRALTSSPAAKSVIEAGRRKIANRVSPDARMVTLTEIDEATSVVEPQRNAR